MRGRAVPQDQILAEVEASVRGSLKPVTPESVAETLAVHWQTAWHKLEGLTSQGVLIRDEFDEEGRRLTQPEWRYILDPM